MLLSKNKKKYKARFLIPNHSNYKFVKIEHTFPIEETKGEESKMHFQEFSATNIKEDMYFNTQCNLWSSNNLYNIFAKSSKTSTFVEYKCPYPWMRVSGIYIKGKYDIPCILICNTINLKTVLYLHENGSDIFNSISHALDLSSTLNANVLIMEYAEFGCYKTSKPLDFSEILNKDYIKAIQHENKSAGKKRKSDTSCGILSQIYEDLKTVILYLESVGEMLEARVLIYGKGLGAHLALYAATELRFKFLGLILHNIASMPKSVKKISEEEIKILNTYIPCGNLERAERLFLPTLCIHTAKDSVLDYSHCQRIIDKIPKKFLMEKSGLEFQNIKQNDNIYGDYNIHTGGCSDDSVVKRPTIIQKMKDFIKFLNFFYQEKDLTTSYSISVAITQKGMTKLGQIMNCQNPPESYQSSKFYKPSTFKALELEESDEIFLSKISSDQQDAK